MRTNRKKISSQEKTTEKLNLDKDGNKLWKLVKALNNENTTRSAVTLQHNGNLLTEKQAANHFTDVYEKSADLQFHQDVGRQCRKAQRDITSDETPDEVMTSAFSEKEIEEAMQRLQLKKSPGPDGITDEIIVHLESWKLEQSHGAGKKPT